MAPEPASRGFMLVDGLGRPRTGIFPSREDVTKQALKAGHASRQGRQIMLPQGYEIVEVKR